MIINEALYYRRRLSGTLPSIYQLCSSLHSFFIERKSLENPSTDNIK